MDLWIQTEGTELIFVMNFSVLHFFKFASRMPQIAQVLISTFKIFWGEGGGGGAIPPDPRRNFLFFSWAVPGSVSCVRYLSEYMATGCVCMVCWVPSLRLWVCLYPKVIAWRVAFETYMCVWWWFYCMWTYAVQLVNFAGHMGSVNLCSQLQHLLTGWFVKTVGAYFRFNLPCLKYCLENERKGEVCAHIFQQVCVYNRKKTIKSPCSLNSLTWYRYINYLFFCFEGWSELEAINVSVLPSCCYEVANEWLRHRDVPCWLSCEYTCLESFSKFQFHAWPALFCKLPCMLPSILTVL